MTFLGGLGREAQLLYIMNLLGLKTERLSMGFGVGTYAFSTKSFNSRVMIDIFQAAVDDHLSNDCDGDRAASLEALKDYQIPSDPLC